MQQRRLMMFGEFSCVVVLQYFKKVQGKSQLDGKPVKYKHTSKEMYIVNEEEDAWEKVAKSYDNKKATIIVEQKKINPLFDMGYSLADKSGKLLREPK